MFFVYVIFSDFINQYYVGQSNDLEQRLLKHNFGLVKSTKRGKTWKLVHVFVTDSRSEAMGLEKSIKKRGAKRFLENLEIF